MAYEGISQTSKKEEEEEEGGKNVLPNIFSSSAVFEPKAFNLYLVILLFVVHSRVGSV